MSIQSEFNEARERVLIAAEQLFAEKGYAPITVRDIAARAGIHHSSVYHHVPGGKEALFVEVMERMLNRHRLGLTEAIQGAARNIRYQLYAAAEWLLSQPPIDLVRMQYADMPALAQHNVDHLSEVAYMSLQIPLETALFEAEQREEIEQDDFSLVSGGLMGMIESLFAVSEETAGKPRRIMAHKLIDVFIDGLRPRAEQADR